jgi:hypothetical protein
MCLTPLRANTLGFHLLPITLLPITLLRLLQCNKIKAVGVEVTLDSAVLLGMAKVLQVLLLMARLQRDSHLRQIL